MIEIEKSPKNDAWYGDFFDSLCVTESCLGENKIAELGPKEIFSFQILLALYLYFITFSLYSAIKVSGIYFLSILEYMT